MCNVPEDAELCQYTQFNMMDMNAHLLEVAQALTDPLRLIMLQHLMEGPATVSELISVTGAAQSKVSNHLALLRARGLVRTTRLGRQIVYELRSREVAQLLESLTLVTGIVPSKTQKSPLLIKARTCYDHLAGHLGVSLFDSLIAREALKEPMASDKMVDLGPAGPEIFGKLGINLAALRSERRRFALVCIDWTERRPHLGGALGAALWARFLECGWVVKQPGTRAVIVTEAGKQRLWKLLQVHLEETSS